MLENTWTVAGRGSVWKMVVKGCPEKRKYCCLDKNIKGCCLLINYYRKK